MNSKRIVILCGPKRMHKYTCAVLIRHGLNIVGICEADQRTAGIPLSYLVRSGKRKGYRVTLSRILARLLYYSLNRKRDQVIFDQLFDKNDIHKILKNWTGSIYRTSNYSSKATLFWLKKMQPDILVVHSPYWVGKRVRALPTTGIILGGHPGITPHYRGSHSAFWALYQGKPQDVGCTVFLLDAGIDTGDIVVQKRIPIEPGDSFMTLGWKGMVQIAELQAQLLQQLERGHTLPRKQVEPPPNSEFDQPTLLQYISYRLRQRQAR